MGTGALVPELKKKNSMQPKSASIFFPVSISFGLCLSQSMEQC